MGHDQAECDRHMSEAKAAGVVRVGDRALVVVWSRSEAMPAPRWTSLDDLSDGEPEALLEAGEEQAGTDRHRSADCNRYSDRQLSACFAASLLHVA